MENKSLVLASGSPRRKELLSQLGYEFSVLVTDVEECKHAQETAEEYVKRLSLDKALAALSLLGDSDSEKQHVVLGSDTVVVSQGQVLEKPADFSDSKRMLTQLANHRHQVMTAVSVVSATQQNTKIVITDVWFKPLSEKEIEQYWETGEPCDKAEAGSKVWVGVLLPGSKVVITPLLAYLYLKRTSYCKNSYNYRSEVHHEC